jgi:hypothetical protein
METTDEQLGRYMRDTNHTLSILREQVIALEANSLSFLAVETLRQLAESTLGPEPCMGQPYKPGEVVAESKYDARRDPTKSVLRDRNGTELHQGDEVRFADPRRRFDPPFQFYPGELNPPSDVILWKRA